MNPRLFCNPLSCIIYALSADPFFPPIHTALLVYICATREEKIHHFVLGSTKKGGVPFPRVFCASEKNVPQWSISHSQHSTTQRVHMKLFLMHIQPSKGHTLPMLEVSNRHLFPSKHSQNQKKCFLYRKSCLDNILVQEYFTTFIQGQLFTSSHYESLSNVKAMK